MVQYSICTPLFNILDLPVHVAQSECVSVISFPKYSLVAVARHCSKHLQVAVDLSPPEENTYNSASFKHPTLQSFLATAMRIVFRDFTYYSVLVSLRANSVQFSSAGHVPQVVTIAFTIY